MRSKIFVTFSETQHEVSVYKSKEEEPEQGGSGS